MKPKIFLTLSVYVGKDNLVILKKENVYHDSW